MNYSKSFGSSPLPEHHPQHNGPYFHLSNIRNTATPEFLDHKSYHINPFEDFYRSCKGQNDANIMGKIDSMAIQCTTMKIFHSLVESSTLVHSIPHNLSYSSMASNILLLFPWDDLNFFQWKSPRAPYQVLGICDQKFNIAHINLPLRTENYCSEGFFTYAIFRFSSSISSTSFIPLLVSASDDSSLYT